MSQLADSFMAIFGLTRVATMRGNVIEPVFQVECDVCGESHRSDNVPFTCENGDGE